MKKRVVVASALAAVAGVIAIPTAAAAAVLPVGQAMYGYQQGFYAINSTDAALTQIGDATPVSSVYGMDYSEQDGVAYLLDDAVLPCEFYSLNITTGILTDVGPIVDGGVDVQNCDALDVAPDGTVYLGSGQTIYEIDTTDGSAVAANVLTGDPFGDDIAWLATDPTTGTLYTGDYDGNLFTVNTSSWVATLFASGVDYIESGDFDGVGTFWFSGDGPEGQGLNSLQLTDPSVVTSYGSFGGADSNDLYALFVQGTPVPAPSPALAATGADMGLIVPFGIGASLLLLAGAGALLLTRKREVH